MIEHCHWMYQRSSNSLWATSDLDAVRTEVYGRDILVNKAERKIRKKIVEHLAIRPKAETTYCLLLMSLVKDAERIGDYCKNLMDLTAYHPTWNDENTLIPEFRSIEGEILLMFARTGKAFRDSDEALGAELVRQERENTRACEALIMKILDTPGLTTRQAVTYTLIARFDKRIAAHLGNIASSLVMPLHKLDYFDETYLPGQEPKPDED
jgi:phosphate uptake regulator